jgi:hypothetical protein
MTDALPAPEQGLVLTHFLTVRGAAVLPGVPQPVGQLARRPTVELSDGMTQN